jgi:hypothetical protein
MTLTSEQILAVREGEPVSLVLPEVGEACVLLRQDVYEQAKRSAEADLPSSLGISRLMAEVAGEDDLDSYQRYKR